MYTSSAKIHNARESAHTAINGEFRYMERINKKAAKSKPRESKAKTLSEIVGPLKSLTRYNIKEVKYRASSIVSIIKIKSCGINMSAPKQVFSHMA